MWRIFSQEAVSNANAIHRQFSVLLFGIQPSTNIRRGRCWLKSQGKDEICINELFILVFVYLISCNYCRMKNIMCSGLPYTYIYIYIIFQEPHPSQMLKINTIHLSCSHRLCDIYFLNFMTVGRVPRNFQEHTIYNFCISPKKQRRISRILSSASAFWSRRKKGMVRVFSSCEDNWA